jgi:pantetheine-phosphate adenylyltransferase
MTRIAIYPGSFDPPTRGHEDLIHRSAGLADRLVVAVANNSSKQPLFSVDDRLAMLRAAIGADARVTFECFDGLLVDFARRIGATLVVRGLRAVSDFEYEFQMALMNRKLRSTVETVFLMPHEKYTYISSRLIKEVASFGTSVAGMVPAVVEKRLTAKFPLK